MSQLGIEFGSKSVISEGTSTSRLRETAERLHQGVGESQEAGGATFGDFLKNLAQDANGAQIAADLKMEEVAAGRSKDLHGAVLALEKADVQFRMLTQVRNKVIEAYREIMRMQV